jgi:DNA-binding XRE family transcriptional regulator
MALVVSLLRSATSLSEATELAAIPLAVSKAANLGGKTLVRAWLEDKGFSQADMAERLGISRPAYAQLEAKGSNLRAATVHHLAAALGVTWEQICEDDLPTNRQS